MGRWGSIPLFQSWEKTTATTHQIVFGCFAETRRGIHYFRVLCPCLVRLSSCIAHFLFLLQKQQKSMLWGTDPPPHENLGYPWTRGEVPQVIVPPPSPFPMGIHVFLKILIIVYQICHRAGGGYPTKSCSSPKWISMELQRVSMFFMAYHGMNMHVGAEKSSI